MKRLIVKNNSPATVIPLKDVDFEMAFFGCKERGDKYMLVSNSDRSASEFVVADELLERGSIDGGCVKTTIELELEYSSTTDVFMFDSANELLVWFCEK
jgi:hypothetical protein|tara:strand:+ start:261 stop:557 length:297 start_codon:yes stop_codon:yes gene_type:complete